MRRMTNLLLALLLLLSLTACSSAPAPGSDGPSQPEPPAQAETPEADAPAEPEPEPYTILDPTVQPEGGVRDGVTYVPYDGVVEHLFFHPVVAYPELAFDLVDIADCWSEQTDESGQPRMVKNTLYLPEGKKPLILSYDDVNYYEYMLANGFTYKLIIGEDGKLWSWGKDPQGKEVVSRDLDAVTILDKFVEEHPDFSPFGAKGCLSLTGYEGILGYRTQTDSKSWTAEQEANRQKDIEAVKPIVAELKRTGWTFGSHTWGHISLNTRTFDAVTADMQKWFAEVGSLVGETSVLFYPFGGRLDGDDVQQSGPAFRWMQEHGFRIFCSVGIDSWSKCKSDISAVICDRLHPDGTTLRSAKARERYMKFYDAKDIIDLSVRPQREVGWMS